MASSYATSGSAAPLESSASAVSWSAIIAGAVAAAVLSLVLMLVGSGLGLTMVSPWMNASASATTLATSTAIWLTVVQWLSSGVGGYMTGRLRTTWSDVPSDESFFRDTAHGLLAWAVATILVVVLLGSAVSSVIGAGVRAGTTVATGAVAGASAGVAGSTNTDSAGNATGYFVDMLFRPTDPNRLAQPGAEGDAAAAAQASRLLVAGAAAGQMAPDDKAYLGRLVAARTGLTEADANARVDAVLTQVERAKTKTQEVADAARKAGATIALLGALSLLIGAFIAAVAAALGGRQRDDMPAMVATTRPIDSRR
jgi:hypothetical protein